MTRGGPAARNAIDPAVLTDFIEAWSEYHVGGHPRRERLYINGARIQENDARMIRRWRAGTIKGVTIRSAAALLHRYGLTIEMLGTFAEQTDRTPTLRGKLPAANSTKETS